MNSVITKIKTEKQALSVRLVGYSGGATLAAILSVWRDDVIELRTVAGNLDLAAFTTHHQVSPLLTSINPVSLADRLIDVPQKHYFSPQDSIVIPEIIESYLASLRKHDPELRCVSTQSVAEVSHVTGWEEFWRKRSDPMFVCR